MLYESGIKGDERLGDIQKCTFRLFSPLFYKHLYIICLLLHRHVLLCVSSIFFICSLIKESKVFLGQESHPHA